MIIPLARTDEARVTVEATRALHAVVAARRFEVVLPCVAPQLDLAHVHLTVFFFITTFQASAASVMQAQLRKQASTRRTSDYVVLAACVCVYLCVVGGTRIGGSASSTWFFMSGL